MEQHVGRVALLKLTNRSALAAEAAFLAEDKTAASLHAQRVLDIKLSLQARGLRWQEVIGGSDSVAHHILGQLAADEGDLGAAERHLIEATETAGSPSLSTFGPDLHLAQTLVDSGRVEAVEEYLRRLRQTWERGRPAIDGWLDDLKTGQRPRLVP